MTEFIAGVIAGLCFVGALAGANLAIKYLAQEGRRRHGYHHPH